MIFTLLMAALGKAFPPDPAGGGGGGPYSFVAKSDNAAGGAGTTITLSMTLTVGRAMLIWVTAGVGSGTFTLSDNLGNTYSKVGSEVFQAWDPQGMACFACKSVTTGGAATLTGGFPSGGARGIGVLEYTGVGAATTYTASAGNFQNTIGATTADLITFGNVTPAAQPALIAGVTQDASVPGGGIAAGTGLNDRGTFTSWSTNIGTASRIVDKRVTSTSATTLTATASAAGQRPFSLCVCAPE